MVKTVLPLHGARGLTRGRGTKIPHSIPCSQKTKQTKLTGQDGIYGRSSCVQLSVPTFPILTSKPSISPLPTD